MSEATVQEVNAAWFKPQPEDATQALQKAIDSPASRIIVPFIGRPWIIGPIALRSHKTILFEPGVQIHAKVGALADPEASLIRGDKLKNIHLDGVATPVQMRRDEYPVDKAHRHVIALYGCQDVSLLGISSRGAGGDGIYIGAHVEGSKRQPCRSVSIVNCESHDNLRQGLSVTAGEDIRVFGSKFRGTKGARPAAGIDLEPNHPDDPLDVSFERCEFSETAGSSILINLDRTRRKSKPIKVTIRNSLAFGSIEAAVRIVAPKADCAKAQILMDGLITRDVKYEAMKVVLDPRADVQIIAHSCRWANVAQATTVCRPFTFELADDAGPGGIEFQDCHLFEAKARPIVTCNRQTKRVFGSLSTPFEKVADVIDELAELKISQAFNESLIHA